MATKNVLDITQLSDNSFTIGAKNELCFWVVFVFSPLNGWSIGHLGEYDPTFKGHVVKHVQQLPVDLSPAEVAQWLIKAYYLPPKIIH